MQRRSAYFPFFQCRWSFLVLTLPAVTIVDCSADGTIVALDDFGAVAVSGAAINDSESVLHGSHPESSAGPGNATPAKVETEIEGVASHADHAVMRSSRLDDSTELQAEGEPDLPSASGANENISYPANSVEARRLDHAELDIIAVTSFPAIQVWAGDGSRGDDEHSLDMPYDLVISGGGLFISDTGNHRVQRWPLLMRSVVPGDEAATIAGGHGPGRGDHQLFYPKGIALDSAGDLFVADAGNHRIMRWAVNATVGEVVLGEAGVLLDKQGEEIGRQELCCRGGNRERQLLDPHGVFVDEDGTLLIADTGNDRVQLVYPNGTVTTAAGGFWSGGSASLSRPQGVFRKGGVLFVADTGNHRVMRWWMNGTEGEVVAGGLGLGEDLTSLAAPRALWVADGPPERGVSVEELYVSDTYNHRIMRYSLGTAVGSDASAVAGSCLESPPYVSPCIGGGLHYPPNPAPDRVGVINPSNWNPPVYHLWGPSGIFLSHGAVRNITVVDTHNHRVVTWVGYR